jgi:non-homologous end joining protein Ku
MSWEVRNEADYFDDIPDKKIPNDMLDLASHIVKTKGRCSVAPTRSSSRGDRI